MNLAATLYLFLRHKLFDQTWHIGLPQLMHHTQILPQLRHTKDQVHCDLTKALETGVHSRKVYSPNKTTWIESVWLIYQIYYRYLIYCFDLQILLILNENSMLHLMYPNLMNLTSYFLGVVFGHNLRHCVIRHIVIKKLLSDITWILFRSWALVKRTRFK